MKITALDYFQCPFCGNKLLIKSIEKQIEDDIREGVIFCKCCTDFIVEDGILDLRQKLDSVVQNEICGWDVMYSNKTIEQRIEWLLSLPFLTPDLDPNEESRKIWKRNGDTFSQAIDQLKLKNNAKGVRTKRILEIGASTCWASSLFAKLGHEVVALDITKNKYYGLDSGSIWIEHQGSFFERVLCDMHYLPFCNCTFDIVFLCNATHHSSDIRRLYKETSRVLKAGGFVLNIIEPIRRLFEKDRVTGREVDLGINEHIYSVFEYLSALKKAGLKPEVFLERHLGKDREGLALLRQDKLSSKNPIKRFLKKILFNSFLPAKTQVLLSMLTNQMSTFNAIARKES